MKILTNEDKYRVFAMYWGAPVSEYHNGQEYPYERVNSEFLDRFENVDIDPKLKLTPLEQISEEDAVEIAKLYYNDPKMLTWLEIGKSIIKQFLLGKDYLKWEAHQLLISRHYAVPLWPWNKTAIELNIAIPKNK